MQAAMLGAGGSTRDRHGCAASGAANGGVVEINASFRFAIHAGELREFKITNMAKPAERVRKLAPAIAASARGVGPSGGRGAEKMVGSFEHRLAGHQIIQSR